MLQQENTPKPAQKQQKKDTWVYVNGFTCVSLQLVIIILSMNHLDDKLRSSQNPLRVQKPQISSWFETKAAIFSWKIWNQDL